MPKLRPGLVIPDTHAPFHDKSNFALMLRAARDLEPEWIVVIGDFMDFYAVSAHPKNPQMATQLKMEIREGNKLLDRVDELGAKEKIYIAGNHCDRVERYLRNKAPELMEITDVPSMLKLEQRGWTYVPYKKHARVGHIYFTHDVGVAGRYSVYKALDTYFSSVITGHAHRLAYIVEGDATGGQRVSAQFGWLGDVEQVDYMAEAKAKKDWAQGFGIGYHNPATDIVYLTPVPIVERTCCVNGKLYQAA